MKLITTILTNLNRLEELYYYDHKQEVILPYKSSYQTEQICNDINTALPVLRLFFSISIKVTYYPQGVINFKFRDNLEIGYSIKASCLSIENKEKCKLLLLKNISKLNNVLETI